MTTDAAHSIHSKLMAPGPAWLPGIAAEVAGVRWRQIIADIGIVPAEYGTERLHARNREAGRVVEGEVRLPASGAWTEPMLIESLGDEVGRSYTELGLNFRPRGSPALPSIMTQLEAALACLDRIDGISSCLGELIRVLHVVLPDGPNYDVSYSDPSVPFSIFVGVADQSGHNGTLRLAEGILHEAMHLQLSLIERVVPLLSDNTEHHYSPWQHTMRPSQGVLHGIYVFAVIRDFMTAFLETPRISAEETRHATLRVEESQAELARAADSLLSGTELTFAGRHLVERLHTAPMRGG